ncbi:DUF3181 family protein [Hydrocoleum sp. CS-953]|uniref:DUF3181 family protein n=1 Tax=Microcoleaceae TaxID=1892252 RepID=UPI000B9BD9B5|nr:DUF3181 family protein [Hydrocoleum sp. CS-953]OZH55065.1 thylakoid-associated protein [Hydrocoleum sp. CS-953]
MTNASTTQIIESLAAEIGDKVYIDIAGWHLYLSDAKLHLTLAEKFYPILTEEVPSEGQVVEILQGVLVKLGAGRKEVPLIDLLPMGCQADLIDVLVEFREKM